MLAVAHAFEALGYEPVIAGGGPGRAFVECNGYEEYTPRGVNFIEDYQNGDLWAVLTRSVPNFGKRVYDYVAWLRRERPAFLVTDDISAAVAATATAISYYYLTHDSAEFYTNAVEQVSARIRNRFTVATSELFALPKVWSGAPVIPGASVIPPIAPESDPADKSVDVLVVPSAFSTDPERLREALEDHGRSVTLVNDENWEIEPSLQPYVEAANVVVCSGYSTVMEAAVAGTPCIILPHTTEQRGVVRALEGTRGFYAAETVDDVVSTASRVTPPERRRNGIRKLTDAVLARVEH
jgi:UDP:flavonoid glycosyltransferase YjiC (YdhE family)